MEKRRWIALNLTIPRIHSVEEGLVKINCLLSEFPEIIKDAGKAINVYEEFHAYKRGVRFSFFTSSASKNLQKEIAMLLAEIVEVDRLQNKEVFYS